MSKSNSTSSHWGRSLRKLSWDDEETITLSQKLISSTVHEWYDAKHRYSSQEEIKLINSLKPESCRLCGSKSFKRNGYYDSGFVRYYCSDCHHSFNPLTGTIFDDKKIPISEWIEYLIHLFEFHSITTSARDNRNAYSTGRYWLFKVFTILEHYQDDIILEDEICYDETFFTVVESKKEIRPDGKQHRGISRNKLCVACAYDSLGHVFLLCENTSKPSIRSTWKTMGSHIKPGSKLIHDGEKSHSVLIDKLNLISEIYDADEIKKLDDSIDPLDPINRIHSLAKKFIRAHGGYDRKNLQGFMNLISFILNEPEDRYEKIDLFINMALTTPQTVRYRDVMSKKRTEQGKQEPRGAN